jgi:hypothetical protein
MAKQRIPELAAPLSVVFGIPRGGKMPVGARFSAADAEVARWIAHHHGLDLLQATSAPAAELAALLREWQLRANGAPILPVISLTVWENLRSLLPNVAVDRAIPGASEASAADPERAAQRLAMAEAMWSALAVNDVVLTLEYDRRKAVEGWWEAVILAIADGVYTTCWLDDPETGFRKRKLTELAPLHPSR